jgi:hypothetical protein
MFNEKLLKPFIKCQIRDLAKVQQDKCHQDDIKLSSTPLPFQLVWLQGNVRIVSHDRDQLELEDTEDPCFFVTVVKCNQVPKGIPDTITVGEYCQILGELHDFSPGYGLIAQVRAIKIVLIDDDVVMKTMWPLEVEELVQLRQI